jgi:hypothetical protein
VNANIGTNVSNKSRLSGATGLTKDYLQSSVVEGMVMAFENIAFANAVGNPDISTRRMKGEL